MRVEAEEEAASNEVQKILGATKPKHIGEGITSGVGYILQGAVGAIGIAVLMPTVAAVEGHRQMGIVGGILGGVGGVVGGAVQAVNVIGGGIVTGVGQVMRGAAATPSAVVAPTQGRWWNANEGAWVSTNLLDEERWVKTQPRYDEDILGEEVMPEDERSEDTGKRKVKDTRLYDLLGLDPSVDTQMIKRRYFIIARKYSPDRSGANDKAQAEFQEVGRAYMILTNEELREKYDRVGYEKLWEAEEEEEPDVNPFMLYTFLFGSEKFEAYTGRLAAASAVRVGDSRRSKVTLEQARLLQKRRVTRLALSLADRLTKWAEEDLPKVATAEWMAETDSLKDASYGVELLHVVGKVYSLAAVQFLGSIDSGIGMPSISKWALKQVEQMKTDTGTVITRVKKVGGDKEKISFNKTVGTAIEKSEGDEDAEKLAKDILKKSTLQSKALSLLWTQTVVDITNTLHEVAQMVLHDQNVGANVRKKRGEALARLGGMFEKVERQGPPIPEQQGLEEVAFHALLDTVWRQELAVRMEGEDVC